MSVSARPRGRSSPVLQSGKHLHFISRKPAVTAACCAWRRGAAAAQEQAPGASARSPSLFVPAVVFFHAGVHWPPVLQLCFVQQRGDSIHSCFGAVGAWAGRVSRRSWTTAKVSVASHPTRGRGSACPPLSVQPPSPPAAAPGGRIAYLLQIKCPHIICFNQDTFERISTGWICNARLGACFFPQLLALMKSQVIFR